MLISVMLLEMFVTANTQSAGVMKEDSHAHIYISHRSYYISYVLETHMYLKGNDHA